MNFIVQVVDIIMKVNLNLERMTEQIAHHRRVLDMLWVEVRCYCETDNLDEDEARG